ncbi:cotf [Roseibium sp. TrichSKD4]|nr:cotf [Roseibium sp. TrichSKD4]
MFRHDYPQHICEEMSLDNLPIVKRPMGDGVTMECNLALDWEFNREGYLRLADAAILEVNQIVEERRQLLEGNVS